MRTPQYYIENSFVNFKDEICRIGKIVEFSANTMINTLSNRMDKLYYILEGKSEFGIAGINGEEKLIWFLGEGSLFPLYSPLNVEYRLEVDSLFLRAITDVKAIEITQEDFKEIAERNSGICFCMLDQYAELADLLLYEVINHSYSDASTKICSFIYVYGHKLKNKGIYMTQEKMAAAVGTSRLNVARTLKMLRDKNIIETSRKSIIVKNCEAIKALSMREIIEE